MSHADFTPKLTEEELELVKRKDTTYLQTFGEKNPDVTETQMKLSESDSKYVEGWVDRRTSTIQNSIIQNPTNCCSIQ